MKKLNSSGFGAVEVLLIIVVIAVVTGAGVYLWKSKQDKPVKQAEVIRCEKPAEAKGWLQYEPEGKAYKVCLPDGWKLNEISGLDVLQTNKNSNLAYQEGTIATVSKESLADSTFVFSMSLVGDAQLNASGEKQQITTESGVTIDRYAFTQTAEPTAVISTPKGATDYVYFVNNGTKIARINYRVLTGEQSNLEVVEKMVKSVQIN